jgi:hypothetical protein
MTRYPALPAHFYQENRKHFSAQMQENHLAVFFSNDVLPTNADGNLIFRQNNDLMYLSGIDQMETILIIFPDAHEDLIDGLARGFLPRKARFLGDDITQDALQKFNLFADIYQRNLAQSFIHLPEREAGALEEEISNPDHMLQSGFIHPDQVAGPGTQAALVDVIRREGAGGDSKIDGYLHA